MLIVPTEQVRPSVWRFQREPLLIVWRWIENSMKVFLRCNPQQNKKITRSSWLNCALRDDEAVYWVSIGHYEAVAVGKWWYWVSRGHLCLYILHKVEISTDVTDASRTDSQTLKDSATQLLIKYKSGALITQSHRPNFLPAILPMWCNYCQF